jgi:hypothetical protein
LADNDPYYYYDYDYEDGDDDYYYELEDGEEEYYPDEDDEPAYIIVNGKNADGTDAKETPVDAANTQAPAAAPEVAAVPEVAAAPVVEVAA